MSSGPSCRLAASIGARIVIVSASAGSASSAAAPAASSAAAPARTRIVFISTTPQFGSNAALLRPAARACREAVVTAA